MAATWIKPIHMNKGKTVAQTIRERNEYAKNPDKTMDTSVVANTRYAMNDSKTAGGALVRSYGCKVATVDEEFLLAKREYEAVTGRSQRDKNILAYHVRQSFKPGEITPREALDVGYELLERFTKGKHAFIVAVHTDRKHIHCHAIFNSTTLDKTAKFKNFWRSSYAVRRLSDLICAEHGLSVIENPKPSKGKTYGKWLGDEKKPSFRDIIKRKIDEILPSCEIFDDFILALKTAGFSVNTGRKYITVSAPEQKRPTRLKTLGKDYTEDAIRARLGGTKTITSGSDSGVQTRPNLLIDIQQKLREGKGAGYEQWARIFNLKEAAKTLIYLKEKGIDSYDDLVKKCAEITSEFDEKLAKIKAADQRLSEISELQKHIGTYGKTREIYKQYRASGWSEKFYEEHRADIVLHRAAKRNFDTLALKKLPTIAELKQEYAAVLAEKKKQYVGYHDLKQNRNDLLTAKRNAERVLGITKDAPTHTDSHPKTYPIPRIVGRRSRPQQTRAAWLNLGQKCVAFLT